MSTFGNWLSPRHVEAAYIDHVVKWLETFVAEAERQFGFTARSIPVPHRGQFTVSREDFQKMPEDQTPAVLVLAPGMAGEARREADRSLTAPIALAFGVIAYTPALEQGLATEIAQILGLAIREIVLRLPPDDLEVKGVRLIDERYGDLEERSMGSSRVIFTVDVANWSPGSGGPVDRTDPPEDPYDPPGNYPLVQPGKIFPFIEQKERID